MPPGISAANPFGVNPQPYAGAASVYQRPFQQPSHQLPQPQGMQPIQAQPQIQQLPGPAEAPTQALGVPQAQSPLAMHRMVAADQYAQGGVRQQGIQGAYDPMPRVQSADFDLRPYVDRPASSLGVTPQNAPMGYGSRFQAADFAREAANEQSFQRGMSGQLPGGGAWQPNMGVTPAQQTAMMASPGLVNRQGSNPGMAQLPQAGPSAADLSQARTHLHGPGPALPGQPGSSQAAGAAAMDRWHAAQEQGDARMAATRMGLPGPVARELVNRGPDAFEQFMNQRLGTPQPDRFGQEMAARGQFAAALASEGKNGQGRSAQEIAEGLKAYGPMPQERPALQWGGKRLPENDEEPTTGNGKPGTSAVMLPVRKGDTPEVKRAKEEYNNTNIEKFNADLERRVGAPLAFNWSPKPGWFSNAPASDADRLKAVEDAYAKEFPDMPEVERKERAIEDLEGTRLRRRYEDKLGTTGGGESGRVFMDQNYPELSGSKRFYTRKMDRYFKPKANKSLPQ
jgi:hypothetical protein